ncbi:MAG: cytochrome c [Candidatus Pseudobacter hemicellulosilyticus]|uniref:Cytochrome c n=1 Tax=Candidatus Pseudobacter hemicellulosilyticus TaxID=3121375 RepID=A0AAJ5WWE6_9BACT|nr:MAG: cytochrome c [Pseudobacter sp.]
MKRLVIVLAGSMLLFALSCSKKSEDNVNNPDPPGGPGIPGCDTANRQYAAHVVPILTANCYGCHGASSNAGSGGIVLEGYNNLRPKAVSGTLIGVITHAAGFPAMPKGGAKLSDCNINVIRSWINNGAQNN